MINYEEFEPESYETSTWLNPTERTVTVKVWRGPETSKKPWLYLTIPPGETRQFPSEYDSAIHTLNKDGVIIGGKGPLLQKVGAPYLLDPVLDTHYQEMKKAIDDAAMAISRQSISEQAAIAATAQIKVATDAQVASQKLHEKVTLEKKAIKALQDKMIEEKVAKAEK